MGWKQGDIDKLLSAGKIRSYKIVGKTEINSPKTEINKQKRKEKPPKPKGCIHIELILASLKVEYKKELKFSDKRRFRFDYSIDNIKLAIEYEGLISAKSRHTTISGFTRDADKYNLAQIEGWRVLRYTARNYKKVEKDIKDFIKNNTTQ